MINCDVINLYVCFERIFQFNLHITRCCRCEEVYKDCGQRIFSRGTLAGAANLLTRHSFYDMSVWEGILQ